MIKDYVSVDIETTGLDYKQEKIIEIGAVRVRNFEICATFSQLVNPGKIISERITNITGIDNGMVSDAPYIDEVIPEFVDFAGGDILLGHNVQFDYSFLKRSAVNANMDINNIAIDTLKIARTILPELEKRKLEYLCTYFGIKEEGHHRAFNDAKVTSELYKILAEKYEDKFPDAFKTRELNHKVKKENPITPRQKEFILDLMQYHSITIDYEIDKMSKNEASRMIDKIILKYGRIM